MARAGLVGRDRERAQLFAGFLSAADDGRGGLYLVSGASGIGKTRLVTEVADAASDAGAAVAWGRSAEEAAAPPLWPWRQVLRTLTSRGGIEITSELSVLVESRPQSDVVGSIGERSQHALFEAVTAFLTDQSRLGPVVVVLDDLQWADTSSLRMLSSVALQLSGAAVLIMGTVRDVEGLNDRETLLADLERVGTTIELGGLDVAETRSLMESVAGEAVAADAGARVHEATGGNPYFIRELSRLLMGNGRLDPAALADRPLPRGISQTLRRASERLDPETVRLLRLASVIGREFTLPVLESAAGSERAAALEHLAEAETHGLVERVALARYTFVHDLARRSFLDDLPPVERARLHLSVGEVMERLHSGDPVVPLAEIAHHFLEGAALERTDRAIAWTRRAAEDAVARYAPEEAVRLYERALQALDLLDRPDDAQRCELLTELALGERAAGLTHARDTARAALDLAERCGPELYARAAVALSMARSLFVGQRPVLADREGLRALTGALERLGDDTRLRVLVLERLVWETTVVGRGQEDPLPYGEEAVRLTSEAPHSDQARGIALMAKGRALSFHPERVEERQVVAEELVALGSRRRDPRVEGYGHVARLTLAFEAAERPEVERSLGAVDDLARLTHDPLLTSHALANRVALVTVDGQLEEARKLVDEGTDRLSAVNPAFARSLLYHRMYLDREHDRLGEYVDLVDGLLVHPAGDQLFEVLACGVHLEAGDEGRGRVLFERLALDGFSAVRRDDAYTTVLWLLTNACCRLGDVRRAEDLIRLWRPFEGRCVVVSLGAGVWLGAASHHLARLTMLAGRHDDARHHLELADEIHRRMGAPLWVLRTRLETARLEGELGHREAATDILASVERTAKAYGAALVVRECRELRESWSGAPISARAAEQTGVIQRAGDLWAISYGGTEITIKDLKGLTYLHRLLSRPGQEVHVLDLVLSTGDPVAAPPGDGLRDPGDAGAVLDPQAKAAYRGRVERLREEVAEAEAFNDGARVERARAEIEAIAEQLAAAVGLGGRDRRAASQTERARVNVTRTLRTAIDRIATVHPSLGHHLATCVRTGTFCVYEPDPVRPVRWHG